MNLQRPGGDVKEEGVRTSYALLQIRSRYCIERFPNIVSKCQKWVLGLAGRMSCVWLLPSLRKVVDLTHLKTAWQEEGGWKGLCEDFQDYHCSHLALHEQEHAQTRP